MEDSPRHRTFIISVWIGLIGILMVGLLGIGGLMVYTRLLAPGPPPTLVAMPTATPPPRPSPTAEATATRVVLPPTPAPSPELPAAFWAGPEVIPPGGCTILHWEVHPPAEAFLDGEPVPPAGQREVCPKETRPYELLVPETGQRHTVMVHVEGSPP
ncbi:MAG: hypothetical protein GTO63_10655, partial [Anaerolineae bacterium]|nr:hypothetical protein [Anaerolineae bacterium]NIN95357.1 hypothetical protein [Anaerolineae bacterium]NIQ78326.1 hypothetical protein [Anaerolineae bacterium]